MVLHSVPFESPVQLLNALDQPSTTFAYFPGPVTCVYEYEVTVPDVIESVPVGVLPTSLAGHEVGSPPPPADPPVLAKPPVLFVPPLEVVPPVAALLDAVVVPPTLVPEAVELPPIAAAPLEMALAVEPPLAEPWPGELPEQPKKIPAKASKASFFRWSIPLKLSGRWPARHLLRPLGAARRRTPPHRSAPSACEGARGGACARTEAGK